MDDGLKYQNIESLQNASSMARETRQRYKALSCPLVYDSMQKMMKQAKLAQGEIEKQYTHYMHAAELAGIIKEHKEFQNFIKQNDKKLLFHSNYKQCIDKLSELQTVLGRKYDDKKLRQDKHERASVAVNNGMHNEQQAPRAAVISQNKGGGSGMRIKISPKELIRTVEKEEVKKNAVILDYRKDKTEKIEYKTDTLITIIQIPHEMVEPNMIFNNLKAGLDVKQRSLLGRLPQYDYVVLMDDDTPELNDNGMPPPGTKASIMFKSLTEYISYEYRTKERPMFMDGGFKMWKAQYPSYITSQVPASPRNNGVTDELDDVMLRLNFKDTTDYLPIQPEPKKVVLPPKGTYPTIPSAGNSFDLPTPPPSTQRPGFGVLPPPKNVPAPGPIPNIPERPGGPIFGPGPAQQKPIVHPAPSQPPPVIPQPDRSNKPSYAAALAGPDKSGKMNGTGATPMVPKRPPIVDRGNKPPLISTELEETLKSVYEQMNMAIQRMDPKFGGHPGAVGLYNLGNTCFMASILQCLFQTPGLREIFTRDSFLSKVNPKNRMGTRGRLSAAFSSLMDVVWSGKYQAFKPSNFLRLFADEVNPELADGRQHDAGEFQLILVSSLSEDTDEVINRVKFVQDYHGGEKITAEALDFIDKQQKYSWSPVHRIFSGINVTEVECRTCLTSSITFEDSQCVSVELTDRNKHGEYSLEDCVNAHYSAILLEGESAWNCPKCQGSRDSVRRFRIWSSPNVLIIHLKRFTPQNGEYVKNNAPVHFDEYLSLKKCLHQKSPAQQETRYQLYGVTNHTGTMKSGHYISMALHQKSNSWIKYDDESVCNWNPTVFDYRAAYILFYKKVGSGPTPM